MVVGDYLQSGTFGRSEFSAVILWSLRIKCNIPGKKFGVPPSGGLTLPA
jgi:hypothetical protein